MPGGDMVAGWEERCRLKIFETFVRDDAPCCLGKFLKRHGPEIIQRLWRWTPGFDILFGLVILATALGAAFFTDGWPVMREP